MIFNKYDIGVFYSGRGSHLIGPPASMRNLSVILKRDFSVYSTPNIGDAFDEKMSDNEMSHTSTVKIKRISGIKTTIFKLAKKSDFLYEVSNLLNYIVFNFRILKFFILNPNGTAIITETGALFGWSKFLCEKIVYIRRANIDWGVYPKSTRISHVKKFFEYLFYNGRVPKVIYLVPQDYCSIEHSVIPNHFSDIWECSIGDSVSNKIYYVGTWSSRKGAPEFLNVSENLIGKATPIVYGAVGGENNLNESLVNSHILDYRGTVAKPYSFMAVGEIYVSSSHEEGLQRSLVEAMISGCIIVGFERPDTKFVAISEGVFIVEPMAGSQGLSDKIAQLITLSASERKELGLSNRKKAIEFFGETSILEKWKSVLND